MSGTTPPTQEITNTAEPSAEATPHTKRSWMRWILPCLALCATVVAGLALYQSLKDQTWAYYTDEEGLRVDAEENQHRMTLWEDPRPHLVTPKDQDAGADADADALQPGQRTNEHVQAAFSPDGSMMVLTYLTEPEEGEAHTDLYLATWDGGTWSKPVPLDAINSPGNEQGATFSADGKHLFFASDRDGGAGGFDLYAAQCGEKGDLSEATALGGSVNTPNNETGPAVSSDGERLYFSSDRDAQGDAQDIYSADRLADQAAPDPASSDQAPGDHQAIAYGNTVPIEELNTDADDIEAALSSRGGYIFLASDRDGNDETGHQLYLSRVVDGVAQAPERVDVYIDKGSIKDPVVRMDGFALLFSSDDPDLIAAIEDGNAQQAGPRMYGSTTREVIGYTDLSRWESFKTLLNRIAWWLLLAIAALVALLYMLEKWQDITSLFHKCLAGSAMVHLLVLFLMMMWMISQEVIPGGEPRSPEVALSIDALAQEELALESEQELAQVAKTTQMVVTKAVNDFREVDFKPTDVATDPVAVVKQSSPDSLVSDLKPSAANESSVSEPLPLLDDAPSAIAELSPTQLPELEVEKLEVQVANTDQPTDPTKDEFKVDEQAIQKVEVAKVEHAKAESPKIDVRSDADSVDASQQPAATVDTGGQTVNPTEGLESDQNPADLDGQDLPPALAANLPGSDPLDQLPLTDEKLETPKHELDPKAITKLIRKQGKPSLEVIEQLGGSEGTERAIARGLDWLSKHQEADGSWDMSKHGSTSTYNTAGAGLALLCYYGWGIQHGDYAEGGKHQKHEAAVTKALDWLIKQQKPDGDLRGAKSGHAMYCHGIAAVALCEAYALTKDPALKKPATLAVQFIINAQHKEGGWRYNPGQAGDLSVTGWQLMALHSARMADIEVPEKTFTAARRFLDKVAFGKHGGRYGYTGPNENRLAMTPTGMFLRQLDLEAPTQERMIESADYLRSNMLKPGNRRFYYEYYATLALYQHQGPIWEQWNEKLKASYLPAQVATGEHTGSWDPNIDVDHARRGGRVTTTALAILSLEVYYRLLPLYGFEREEPKP